MSHDCSTSRIGLFRNCHYAHFLKYGEKLQKKQKNKFLVRGSMFHDVMEKYNSGISWQKAFKPLAEEFYKNHFKEEIVEMGDIPKMVHDLFLSYHHYYFDNEPYDYLANELEFSVPLLGNINLIGYIDSIAKDENGKIWGVEHKTYGKMPDLDFLMYNNQSNNYFYALIEMGYDVAGFMWNIIKAKQPTKPQMLDSGKMSLRKLDSTPIIVREGIKELGFNPDDYQDFINNHSYSSYFYRRNIRFNKKVMKSLVKDTQDTAFYCINHLDDFKDRNLTKNCKFCQYSQICGADLKGLDTQYIIDKEYETRERREDIATKKETSKKRKKARKK